MILAMIARCLAEGARLEAICDRLGISARTVQRWQKPELAEDRRAGPKTAPKNKLSTAEQERVMELANSPEFRDLSPKQMVPRLADRGVYVASESTVYRLLRQRGLLAHRGRAKPRTPRPRPSLIAARPNQVWTWDITYLRSPVRGKFLYLYLLVDVFSRRIMGWKIAEEESSDIAAELFQASWKAAGSPEGLKLHSDNGGPMKGSTMLATLQRLGVVASFSRPRVSDDNAYSEALFRTLKYCPSYPSTFAGPEDATAWVTKFVGWYNGTHLHSGINFVSPDDRHAGVEQALLRQRAATYERARRRNPARWSGQTRNWSPAGPVTLNPSPSISQERKSAA